MEFLPVSVLLCDSSGPLLRGPPGLWGSVAAPIYLTTFSLLPLYCKTWLALGMLRPLPTDSPFQGNFPVAESYSSSMSSLVMVSAFSSGCHPRVECLCQSTPRVYPTKLSIEIHGSWFPHHYCYILPNFALSMNLQPIDLTYCSCLGLYLPPMPSVIDTKPLGLFSVWSERLVPADCFRKSSQWWNHTP